MTRTQISLEERQYLFVKQEAARRGTSLSAVVRDLIERGMRARDDVGPRLSDMAGLFAGGGTEGLDHDHHIYGWPTRSGDQTG